MTYETRIHTLIIKPPLEEIYSEMATHVRADDEGAGIYFVLCQGDKEVKIDPEEWPHIVAAIERLMEEWRQ